MKKISTLCVFNDLFQCLDKSPDIIVENVENTNDSGIGFEVHNIQ